jgi:hypothetical protein
MRSDTRYYLPAMKIPRSDVLQPVACERWRAAPIIVPALLGAVILTDVTPVWGRVRNLPTPETMPSRSVLPGIGRRNLLGEAAPPAQPLQNRATSGPWRVLTGIIAYTDPKQGFVMIGNSVQNTFLARPGDQLPDGSRIREIRGNQVVLESGGRLETVGMYEHERPAAAVYATIPPIPPMPQQARWGMELKQATAGDAIPSHLPRSPEQPPGEPRPSDTRAGDIAMNPVRSNDSPPSDSPLSGTQPSNVPSGNAPSQAQPQDPLSPSTQDPADELGDARRQRAEDRRK